MCRRPWSSQEFLLIAKRPVYPRRDTIGTVARIRLGMCLLFHQVTLHDISVIGCRTRIIFRVCFRIMYISFQYDGLVKVWCLQSARLLCTIHVNARVTGLSIVGDLLFVAAESALSSYNLKSVLGGLDLTIIAGVTERPETPCAGRAFIGENDTITTICAQTNGVLTGSWKGAVNLWV